MKQAALLALLCSVLLIPGCGRKSEEEETAAPANVEVSVARVEQGLIRRVVEASGPISPIPDRDVKVSAQVAGRITDLRVQEGDSVAAGQTLAKIDDAALQDQLRQAEAALENARLNEERATKLFERGIAAGKEKEDAHRDLVAAQAAFDTAGIQVSRATVKSPIAGVVVKRFVSLGEQVDGTAGQPLLEIANFDVVELTAALQASYLGDVREGQEAEVVTDAYPDRTFPAAVVRILPSVNQETNTATVRIRMKNESHELKGGMFATARIVAGAHPQAILIPTAALVTTNNEPKVYVLGADSRVREQRVEPGWREDSRIEILKGLRPGDQVVTTGSFGLADGISVSVKKP